jgi:hypothetical protein
MLMAQLKTRKTLNRPAQTVDELSITLRTEPLVDKELQQAFYSEDLNAFRVDCI